MRLVRYADLVPMRWKNGGGETREVAVYPPGAALDAFDWRVSMAHVAVDGPFSSFPEVDRTLAVLDGAGFDLAVKFAAPVRLTTGSAPHAFPADVATVARLVDGPVLDLNVMTRRGRFGHVVEAIALEGSRTLDAAGGTLIAICRSGEIAVGGRVFGRHDALVASGQESLEIASRGEAAHVLATTIHAL